MCVCVRGLDGEGGTFWVFLGLMMVLIVEVVLIVEEERTGEGEFSVVDHSQQVEPVFIEIAFLLLAAVACISVGVHRWRKE